MRITLNGESTQIQDNASIADLIAMLELNHTRYAVEVNEELVPRSQHSDYRLQAGDVVEVVQAIGGG